MTRQTTSCLKVCLGQLNRTYYYKKILGVHAHVTKYVPHWSLITRRLTCVIVEGLCLTKNAVRKTPTDSADSGPADS